MRSENNEEVIEHGAARMVSHVQCPLAGGGREGRRREWYQGGRSVVLMLRAMVLGCLRSSLDVLCCRSVVLMLYAMVFGCLRLSMDVLYCRTVVFMLCAMVLGCLRLFLDVLCCLCVGVPP